MHCIIYKININSPQVSIKVLLVSVMNHWLFPTHCIVYDRFLLGQSVQC